MGPVSDERATWLARNVLPHERALRAWLRARRLNGLEIDDIVQETYTRLIIAPTVDHIRNTKAYTFQTASSVIADCLRKMKVVSIDSVFDLEHFDIVSRDPSPEDYAVDRDELHQLVKAIAALPEKVRQVFIFRRVDGLSQREVAVKMNIAESTVEKHMARGFLLMSDLFLYSGKETESSSSIGPDSKVRGFYAKRDRSRD
jgi:RNA polymerase sigma factor (sigma-70 family)